jgi:hypothetical protein
MWLTFGTGDVHENEFEAKKFRENQCRISHTIVIYINEFQDQLSDFDEIL